MSMLRVLGIRPRRLDQRRDVPLPPHEREAHSALAAELAQQLGSQAPVAMPLRRAASGQLLLLPADELASIRWVTDDMHLA